MTRPRRKGTNVTEILPPFTISVTPDLAPLRRIQQEVRMDARERRVLDLEEDELYSEHPTVMDETCVACGCRVGNHWMKVNGGKAIGWVGCAVALAAKQAGAA